jgi:phage FluMu protein Com
MQIRCNHCHRPYALNKDMITIALDNLYSEDQHYYNAPCPHCRRSNQVSRQELERAAPGWKPPSTEEE